VTDHGIWRSTSNNKRQILDFWTGRRLQRVELLLICDPDSRKSSCVLSGRRKAGDARGWETISPNRQLSGACRSTQRTESSGSSWLSTTEPTVPSCNTRSDKMLFP